eukprot:6472354-Amphidinium_carterae.1
MGLHLHLSNCVVAASEVARAIILGPGHWDKSTLWQSQCPWIPICIPDLPMYEDDQAVTQYEKTRFTCVCHEQRDSAWSLSLR